MCGVVKVWQVSGGVGLVVLFVGQMLGVGGGEASGRGRRVTAFVHKQQDVGVTVCGVVVSFNVQ